MNKQVVSNVVLVLMVWLPLLASAQPGTLISSARSVDSGSVRRVSDTKTGAAPQVSFGELRLQPLFGEQSKSPEHIEWEIRFLNDCDQNFATRTEASEFFAARGWDYLAEGQLDTATYRFNLSHVLNAQNADAYWGLGVVSYQRSQLPEAIRLLKKGMEVADTNAVLITDLATVELKLYETSRDEQLLEEAISLLKRSATLYPAYVNTYMKLSWAHFCKADYAQAWSDLHRGRAIDLGAIDLVYLKQLIEKMPDPQGVFK